MKAGPRTVFALLVLGPSLVVGAELLVPAVPLVGLVDGVVSCLRTYTTAELEAMTAQFGSYRWRSGRSTCGVWRQRSRT